MAVAFLVSPNAEVGKAMCDFLTLKWIIIYH
jgi:hypothetical protein